MVSQNAPVIFSQQQTWSLRPKAGVIGGALLLVIALPCYLTLPWSVQHYQGRTGDEDTSRQAPSLTNPLGTDALGRSMLWRLLLGGAISLGIGISAAGLSVILGVAWGAASGYAGGQTDAAMMRTVDVLYGLPYILLVVLIDIAFKPAMVRVAGWFLAADVAAGSAEVLTLLVAIGGVSWLTMARVIRGQVLSLRSQPFIEAARACGIGPVRICAFHLLPNLIGPIVVYTTLTVPSAILQESFLSFLGIGVRPPLPSWGNLAADGLPELLALTRQDVPMRWWLIVWPCALLGLTLMALNFLGDALRDRLDPKTKR